MIGQHADILVIDDELTVCRSCQKILNVDGYDVSIALSGYEGLEKFRKKDFDLAIVDLKMPDINGMQVVEAIKTEQPTTEVIIMTGYSTVASAVTGMKMGAADYIPKPFTPDEMLMAVKKALIHQGNEVKEQEVTTEQVEASSEEVTVAQMTLENGAVLEAEAFEAGSEVFIVTEDEKVAVPVGEYTMEDGMILVVAEEGIIGEINFVNFTRHS